LFAGKDYAMDEKIAMDESLLIKLTFSIDNQLNNYIFGTHDEDYANLNLGVIALMNDHAPRNTRGHLAGYPSRDMLTPAAAHSVYTPTVLLADAEILAGDELFTSYGGEEWFADRNITLSDSAPAEAARPEAYLPDTGHCLSDVQVQKSGFNNAMRGMFAARSFKSGEVVSISPALLLSKKHLQSAASHSVMINYAISANGSDAALVPFGRGAMANNGGEMGSNMIVQWYDWKARRFISEGDAYIPTDTPIAELTASPFVGLNVAYIATKDIEVNEELTIFYGDAWEKAWVKYERRMNNAHLRGLNREELQKIMFRRPMQAPSGMFPLSWFAGPAAPTAIHLDTVKTEL
jgi:hypothetical protein